MLIDSHTHVFLNKLPMPDRRRAPSGYDATPEALRSELSHHGFSHAVLVQPSFLGTDNSYLLQALQAYPDQFRGIAVVAPDIAAAELDAMQAAGVVGIRLNLIDLPAPDFSSPAWQALLDQLRQRAWLIEIHQRCQHLPALLDPLMETGLNLVIDHFGRPQTLNDLVSPAYRRLLSHAGSGRLWVKLSAAYRNGPQGTATAQASLALLREHCGFDRLLWGSDWPHTRFETQQDYAGQCRQLENWLPTPQARQQVLSDNPARLFKFFSEQA